jgi:hypothetical protein
LLTTRALIPNLTCEGSLSWTDVKPGNTVYGNFTVENIGEDGSFLDWEISTYPTWGSWSFNPESGADLEVGILTTVDIELHAPDEQNTEFEGEIVLVNIEDPDDTCTIPVTLVTPCESPFLQLLDFLMQRFPILGRILNLII